MVLEGERLRPEALRTLDKTASRGRLLVPAVSVWEVAMLAARGRIVLDTPTKAWVASALAVPGVGLEPLTPEIAVEAYELPGRFHGDPADRMIVATARVRNATLVTRDRRIVDYGALGHVNVLPG